jgi:hypothetical protein
MESTASLDRLRGVLRANAAFSARGGPAALAAFFQVDDLMGEGSPALVALTGVGLIGFELFVLMVAELEPTRLLRGTAVVSVADAAWVRPPWPWSVPPISKPAVSRYWGVSPLSSPGSHSDNFAYGRGRSESKPHIPPTKSKSCQ